MIHIELPSIIIIHKYPLSWSFSLNYILSIQSAEFTFLKNFFALHSFKERETTIIITEQRTVEYKQWSQKEVSWSRKKGNKKKKKQSLAHKKNIVRYTQKKKITSQRTNIYRIFSLTIAFFLLLFLFSSYTSCVLCVEVNNPRAEDYYKFFIFFLFIHTIYI